MIPTYWAAYWFGSPKESSIWEVNGRGEMIGKLLSFGNSEKDHIIASYIVEYHNNGVSNGFVV